MSKVPLKRALVSVLRNNEKSSDIADDDNILTGLHSKLTDEPTNHLKAFAKYLENDCDLSPTVILQLAEALMTNPDASKFLGIKAINFWLEFKIYEAMDIAKKKDGDKRKKVGDTFATYNCSGSDLASLLKACCVAISNGADEEVIKDMFDAIVENRNAEIQQVFYQEPEPQPIAYNPDKSIQEQLKDLINDYKYLPEGSVEKELQREIALAYAQKYKSLKNILDKQMAQSKQRSDIDELRQKFVNQLSSIPSQIEELFKKAKGDEAYEPLCAIKSKIFSINVLELERLIHKTNDAREMIQNKDVLFIIGNTGSGKSTNILKFLGYTLRIGKFGKLTTLVPVEPLQLQHKTFYTSPQAKSCTRYINAVPVPDKMYKKGLHESKKTLVICDSPGFGDSAGVEVDIANGVGMINALHGARSVRVVVILPYDSLTADRMAGAIKMSEIISNLFHELTVMESIAIYFNKVPSNKISEVPEMIEDKLTHLTSIEKSNSKLTMFLKEILERSREEENFIDPLEGDFKALFNTLVRMPAITDVRENFQYEFTQSTKREIEKFAQGERSKVREYFIDKKFKNAQFHLRMLQKLMNILHNNDKIQGYYNQLAEFIQEESEKELTYYEELVMQIINCKESYNLKDRLKDSKDKIAELQILFSDFEELKVVSSDKVSQIIQDNKNRLLNQFNNLSEVTSETILAAKSFSLLLDKDLEGKIIKIIERRFNDVYGEAEQQARHKSYDEMEDNLKILVNLVGFNSQLSQKSALNNLASRLRDLKGMLNQEVDTGFTDISDNITKGQARLTENTVNEVNKKIQRIKTIQALKFLDNNTEVRAKLNNELKAIETKCKKIIRQLQNLKLSLNEEVQAKNSIEKDQLINKKRHIQFLMRIENIGENLKDDYQYAKQSIQRKLKENVEILKTCIVALKGNKNDEIYKNLQNIKKATIVVVQCSKIVEDSENNLDLAQSIETEFIQFLNGEIMAMRSIQIKLNQINSESFVKIRLHHNKIESYSKMGMIGDQVESSVEQLRNELSEKLKAPFLEFKQREIPYLEQKKHYKYLPYSIEKFEKLSLFALEIEDILSPDEYKKISQCEIQIEESLKNLYKTMQLDIETFIDLEFEHGKYPSFLKDLIKTLLAISLKAKSCEYLTRKLNFEVNQKLINIQAKLDELKDKMENSFGESHINVEEIQALLADCKFYSEIEDVYKSKGEVDKFGFRDLLKRCQDEFNKSLKNDQDRIKEMINNTKPSKISFNELQGYYDKFTNIKGQQGTRKRRIITTQLRKVEQKTLQDLKQFKHEMDDLTFINNSSKIDDFLDAFYEAVELEKNLKKLYTLEDDKGQIEIKQADIRKIGIKIINVFESEFQIVRELLKNYNLGDIINKLKTFGSLEAMIYEVFNLEHQQQTIQDDQQTPGNPLNDSFKVLKFIKENANILRGLIESHQYIKEEKINAKNTKRLKNLLQILKNGVQQEVKVKYDNSSPNFVIDDGFEKYYSYASEPKKLQLKHNVDQYLKDMHKQYKEKFNNSADLAKTIELTIEQRIRMLPTELKFHQGGQFEKVKISLTTQNEELIARVSKSLISNPANVDNFFNQAQKAKNNGQAELHAKWVTKFQEIYSEQEQKTGTVDQKIAFVQASLIQVYVRHKDYLKSDNLMYEVLRKKYNYWLNVIMRAGKQSIISIESMLNNNSATPSGNEQKKAFNHIELIISIFKIYNFIMRLRDDTIGDHTELRKKFAESYQNKLEMVINCYSQTLKNKPEEKLDTKQIIQPAKMKKLQTYIHNVSLAGEVIDLIKAELEKSRIVTNKSVLKIEGQVPFLNSIYSIQRYQPVFESYENQIEDMLKTIKIFEFYGDVKRNMAPKEIQEDLNKLDRFYEILEVRQDFFLKYIIKKSQNAYDFKIIAQKQAAKFDLYVREAQEEIVDTFKNINGEPAVRINLLIKQLSIMRSRQRQLKFLPADKVKEIYDKITKQIKTEFDKVRNECNATLENAKSKFNKVLSEAQTLESKKRDDVKSQNNRFKKMIDDKVETLRKKCDEKVSVQTDQNKKQDHRNAMATDVNSIRNELGNDKDIRVRQLEEECDRQVKIKYETLVAPINAFTLALTILQKALIDIYEQADKYKKILEVVLEGLQKISPKFIKLIENSLLMNANDYRSIGKLILTSSKIFNNFSVTLINKLIKGQDINYVLKNLQRITLIGRDKVPDNEMRSIEQIYKQFKMKYDEFKDNYKRTPTETTINYMLTPLKDLGNQIKNQFYQSRNPLKQAKMKIELLAGIFALWAILKSESYDGEVEYTIEPHPTQITTLILLLGISHPNEILSNRLAQVGTGEGKSIVLAGLSCYLALVGFKVRCACYSSYLSGRDQESFKILFQKLGVEGSVKYGTFNQLCEDILNGSGANLKDQVEKMLLQPPKGFFQHLGKAFGFNNVSLNRGPNEIMHNPTILVIDEVDVFFEDSFFGNTYCPAITLRGPAVSRFLQYVWRQVQTTQKDTEPSKLINSDEFKDLVNRYPSIKDLLKNQVHGMVAGALNYVHDYHIIEKRIGYKDSDSISYKINYGYKTVFAYLHEFQHNRVARPYLDQALQISLMVAEFSYAALPKYFCHILGVTGTLEVLPHYKKFQLSDRYQINDQYAIPSAFGINKKRIEEYCLTKQQSYYNTIVEKINKVTDNRPIIIFFKGPRELNEFFNSKQYQPFLRRTSNLTEEHEASVRDNRIYRAVNPGNITLMSSAFGRGTDFVLLDDLIKEKGGLHVIHAFLSLDESQEVQIKGRTARQNNKGSYDCVISENWLEELTLTPAQIPKNATSDDIHSILLRAREERIDKLSQSTIKMLLEADRKHNHVVEIFSKPKLAQEDLINYVATLNQYPEIRKVVIKTVLGLDATGSMTAALRKCCEIIGTAFEQTYAVLQQKDVKATIEVKIMVYRNYNSPCEQIIEGTTFENTSVNLRSFLNRVGPKGGWGNEALQVLFQFLNREQRIDQVILIGDAAPNNQMQVGTKRNERGEAYWVSKGFPSTHIDREIQIFKFKKCPVHSFYLNGGAGFKDISARTGGTAAPFEIRSPKVTQNLTQFVVENILVLIEKNSGKGSLGLVETYRKMFVK